jgi:hypothetical protein
VARNPYDPYETPDAPAPYVPDPPAGSPTPQSGPRVPGTGAQKDPMGDTFPGDGNSDRGAPNPEPPADQGGPGNCPPGEVWHCWPAPCRCEPPDALSKADKDTCDWGTQPEPRECYWCDFDTQQWVRGWCGETKGGGGGGGGAKSSGGGGAGGAGGPSGASANFNAYLEQIIRGTLDAGSRYTPEALQAMYGEISRQASNQIHKGERDVRAEAARRGMSRAGSTDASIRAVREGAERQRGQAIVGVQTAKINADFQDKLAAIDRGQHFLDSMRDSEHRWALMSEQRKQFDANLALSYANLAQQRSNLQMQMQQQWDMMRAQQSFSLMTGGL